MTTKLGYICRYCDRMSASQPCSRCRKDRRRARPNPWNDGRWRAYSASYLEVHPRCEDESGCRASATEVHHIDGLGPQGPKGYDLDNLQPLCSSHHSRKTMTELNRQGVMKK